MDSAAIDRIKRMSYHGCRNLHQAAGKHWDLSFEQWCAIYGLQWGARKRLRIKLELIDPARGFVEGNVYLRDKYGEILEPTTLNQNVRFAWNEFAPQI